MLPKFAEHEASAQEDSFETSSEAAFWSRPERRFRMRRFAPLAVLVLTIPFAFGEESAKQKPLEPLPAIPKLIREDVSEFEDDYFKITSRDHFLDTYPNLSKDDVAFLKSQRKDKWRFAVYFGIAELRERLTREYENRPWKDVTILMGSIRRRVARQIGDLMDKRIAKKPLTASEMFFLMEHTIILDVPLREITLD